MALIGWARRSRFAGSKDRAAVRDHVFDAVRCRRRFVAWGGAMTGRGLMLGALRAASVDPGSVFTGEGHAPVPLTGGDGPVRAPEAEAEALDMPDWLWSRLEAGFGEKTSAIVEALRQRAPVHLRVNLRKATRAAAMAALQRDGIETDPQAVADTALDVRSGARKVKLSPAYLGGRVELQDAASQAVVALPLQDGLSVLDYCADGCGKSLAIPVGCGTCLSARGGSV